MRYEIIETEQQAQKLLGELQRYRGPVGFDCETTGVDPTKEGVCHRGRIYCWSLAVVTSRSRDIRGIGSVAHSLSYYIAGKLLPLFGSFLETAPLVGHNIHGFDRHMLANHGIFARNIAADTARMFRLYNPDKTAAGKLKPLCHYWLGFHQPSFDSITKRPDHAFEIIEHKLRKNEVGPVVYRETRRKVGDQRAVPTLLVAGPVGKFYKKMVHIPLDELERDYPERWQAFMKYSALDAGLTLELYLALRQKLATIKWSMVK